MNHQLPRYSLLTTGLFLGVTVAQANNYCSRIANTWPETVICSDSALKTLDETLNNTYNQARHTVVNKKALRDMQRQWLSQTRNQCRDKECLSRVYHERIAELGIFYVSALPISSKSLGNQEAKNICQSLAILADQKRLADLEVPSMDLDSATSAINSIWNLTNEEKVTLDVRETRYTTNYIDTIYLLRLSPSKPPVRFASFFTGGTCASYETYSIPYLLSHPEDNGDEPVNISDEENMSVYWGGGDYPVFYQGRNLMITADIANHNKASMVSWIKPDGRKRPLCLLNVKNTGLNVAATNNRTLCAGIVNGTIPPLSWQPVENATYSDESLFIKHYGNYANGLEAMTIDLDGDGKLDNIGRFIFDSGAGCGSTQIWLSALSQSFDKTIQTPLNDQFSEISSGTMDIYPFKGLYYIATRVDGTRNGVIQISKGGIQQICEFQQKTKTTVSKFFPVVP